MSKRTKRVREINHVDHSKHENKALIILAKIKYKYFANLMNEFLFL